MNRPVNGNGRRPACGGSAFRLGPTVSRRALLRAGGDERFREMVADLITVSLQIQKVRDALARRIGITGPQYSIVLAVARMGAGGGVNVGAVAAFLHVSAAFVTAEAGKLVRKGLLAKAPSAADRRAVLLRLTGRGESRLAFLTPEIRAVNDRFFASLDRADFANLARIARALADDSEYALAYLSMAAGAGAASAPQGVKL
jgi:DNA-binding MarR family transcriptional regulator